MKILVIITGDNPGGIERFVSTFLRELDRRGLSHAIAITRTHGGYYADYYKETSTVYYEGNQRRFLMRISFLHKVITKQRPTIVFNLSYWQGLEGALANRFRAKYFVSYRSARKGSKTYSRLKSNLMSLLGSKYLAVSNSVKENMINTHKLPSSKIWVTGNGIELSNYKNSLTRKVPKNGQITILNIANLTPVKNHSVILEVAKLARDKGLNWKFLIFGDGPQREVLERLVCDYELYDYVDLPGFVDSSTGLYDEGNIFLIPSLVEGMSQVTMESLASGLPVVGSNVSGINDLIEHTYNGLLVDDPKDYHGFFRALSLIIESDEIYLRYAQNAAKSSLQFDIQNCIENHLNVFSK